MDFLELLTTTNDEIVDKERQKAVSAFLENIHKQRKNGHYALVFEHEGEARSFPSTANISRDTYAWVWKNMEAEGLVEFQSGKVSLTEKGIKLLYPA